MYLIDCKFSENMADVAIYLSGDRKLQWGHRIFYRNCHREGGDFAWFKDNTSLKKSDFDFKEVFEDKWKLNID